MVLRGSGCWLYAYGSFIIFASFCFRLLLFAARCCSLLCDVVSITLLCCESVVVVLSRIRAVVGVYAWSRSEARAGIPVDNRRPVT